MPLVFMKRPSKRISQEAPKAAAAAAKKAGKVLYESTYVPDIYSNWSWNPDVELTPTIKGVGDPNAIHVDDPVQGYLDDCYLVAALAAVAYIHPDIIESMIEIETDGDEKFWVVTFHLARNSPVRVRFPFGAPLKAGADGLNPRDLYFARSYDVDTVDGSPILEAWPMVLETAIAQVASTNNPETELAYPKFSALENPGSLGGKGVFELLLGSGKYVPVPNTVDAVREFLLSMSNPVEGQGPGLRRPATPLVLQTRGRQNGERAHNNPPIPGWEGPAIGRNHAYTVRMIRVAGDSGDWLTLRNPLGSDHLMKFPLELLLIDEPEYPGVKVFRRFTVGELVKPTTQASSGR